MKSCCMRIIVDTMNNEQWTCYYITYNSCAIEILAMTVNQRSIETMSKQGQLITTNGLLTSLPDEIINNTINDVKHYFTDHVWYELLQRGISKYLM